MQEHEAYLEIAKRFITNCHDQLNNGINYQEVLGFNNYHAFECIAGAFNSSLGQPIPKSHNKKLNVFVINSRREMLANARAIATLAIMLNSVRNKCLYPVLDGSSFLTPQNQISLTDTRTLIRRVNGIINQIENRIS